MLRATVCMCLSLVAAAAFAAEPAPQKDKSEAQATAPGATKKAGPAADMVLSGLSIVGNDESPKELVIVPWKSSQLADAPGISRLLDDSTQPVDKDVFMRELAFYGLQTADPDGN
ncbi:hypothetical protein [Lysobacter niastensis]|uniref:Uncharacterized protein n=1 Tax=Lysobacter niastensis TaxID=380629 RepID=A0ABS0B5A2_9GAMM|nr:hypothetical protein [Lysobacter niastensis]MBF6023994.1 hypothetical protein [Lysobacter niastensis]